MPVIDRIKDFQNDLVAIRRDIHAHPEIGFEETRTSAIVADLLETWGITALTAPTKRTPTGRPKPSCRRTGTACSTSS